MIGGTAMLETRCRALMGLTLGALVSVLVAAPAESQDVAVERLSSRVLVAHVPLLGRSNVVAVATQKGLVLIDTGVALSLAGKTKQELESQLGRTDWAYVINTHAHDHVGGNALFKHLPLIAHENIVGEMKTGWIDLMASEEKRAPSVRFVQGKIQELQKQLDGGAADSAALKAQMAFWRPLEGEVTRGFEVAVPALRFSEDLTLDMGDATIRAMYFGQGHSSADVVVYIPEERLLVSGGACNPFLPAIGASVQLADLQRSLVVLERVLDSGVDHVVAGHAEVVGGAVVQRWRDYYRDLLAGVRAAHDQGLTVEQTRAQLTLEQRFPYMREAQTRGGSNEEAHAANVAAVWKLVTQP
jgi:glyoxylase-like metal-dependent hydrolase (beta-lactamase superfamily II)